MIKKGTIIASVKAANLVPPKLAPRYTNENNNKNSKKLQLMSECIERLFSKLNLEGADEWTPNVQAKMNKVFKDYNHIFALDDL